jgi:methylase of polypeptide subunit release factors
MLLVLLDGKLYLAPIKPNLQHVLDVGTGTGSWAIEFGIFLVSMPPLVDSA